MARETIENYYTKELDKVTPNQTEFPCGIKVFANGNGWDTKNLSLNKDSAKAIIEWLQKNYLDK